jgi:single-strand DNA-binding protein
MSTSRSLNKVMLIGNLTRDPQVRETGNGSVVCTFGVATNTTWRDGSGAVQERTEYHNVVAWNKLAEICADLLAVSMSVYVEGELRTRSWEDANGSRQYKTEIKALDMKLLDSKGKKGVGVASAKQSTTNGNSTESFDDDDTAATPKVEKAEEVVAEVKEAPVQETAVIEESVATENEEVIGGDDLF